MKSELKITALGFLVVASNVVILRPNLLMSTGIHTVAVPVELMKHFLTISCDI